MSYNILEDFLEAIEVLPQEIKEQLLEIEKKDGQVQDMNHEIEKTVGRLFLNASLTPGELDKNEYDKVVEKIQKTIEISDEKVKIAEYSVKMIGRYISQLQKEVDHFERVIDSDSTGMINKIKQLTLSRNALQQKWDAAANLINENDMSSDYLVSNTNRYRSHISLKNSHTPTATDSMSTSSNRTSSRQHNRSIKSIYNHNHSSTPKVIKSMTPSKKMKDYHAVASSTPSTHNQPINISESDNDSASRSSKNKKNVIVPKLFELPRNDVEASDEVTMKIEEQLSEVPEKVIRAEALSAHTNLVNEEGENTLYCICRQVSYGDMIACDNPSCDIGWLHYCCVGLTEAPKGDWFCPKCVLRKQLENNS